jgi:hypothetical protein
MYISLAYYNLNKQTKFMQRFLGCNKKRQRRYKGQN